MRSKIFEAVKNIFIILLLFGIIAAAGLLYQAQEEREAAQAPAPPGNLYPTSQASPEPAFLNSEKVL